MKTTAKCIPNLNQRPRRPAGFPGLALIGLCLFVTYTAAAADLVFLAVTKGQRYVQPGPNLVMLSFEGDGDGDSPLAFEAFAQGTTSTSLISGTVQLPGGTIVPLTVMENEDGQLGHRYLAEELLTLNTDRPNGSYTMSLVTRNDGVRNVTLSLAGDVWPANAPRITNLSALQTNNHAANITVQWNGMGNGTVNDFIMLSVSEENGGVVFETPGPGASGALNGLATQAIIPANTLQAGRTYQAELLFVKVVALDLNYGIAVAGYYKMTDAEIRTQPLPGTALGARFLSATPPSYAGSVERNSAIAFSFSHPMNPAFNSVSWSGNGLNGANFSYEWLDGNRILLCKYNGNLPGNTEINWQLNLADFRDAAGFALSGVESGNFFTSQEDPGLTADVDGCYLVKARGYWQSGTTPVATGMFGCDANVEMSAFNRVKDPARLVIAANNTTNRLLKDQWDGELFIEATYASKAELDQYFPNGSFSFNLQTVADGARTVTLNLGATDDYPPAPRVSNWAALQTINPATDTVISWDALSGWNQDPSALGTFIEVEIENDQGNEVFYLGPGEGVITANGCTIPAGTLWPGRAYRVSLSFVKVKDWNTTYGNNGNGAGFRTVTEFTIQTTGTPIRPNMRLQPAGRDVNLIIFGGEPERNYLIEASTDLKRWLPQEVRWLGEGTPENQYYDPDAHYLPMRFYRLQDAVGNNWWNLRHIAIQGTVWADANHTTPVKGAVVGTSLDGRTAITDAAGNFFLETDTKSGNGTANYTIVITVGAQTKYFGPLNWGDQPREQHFSMQ